MVGIYKITSPSGKVYIGQSTDIERRFNNYKKYLAKTQRRLHNSFLKYGTEKHLFEILHLLSKNFDQEKLNLLETQYINLYKELGIELLNIREGGGAKGKHNPETIQKLRKNKSLEHKIKIGKANLGKVRKPEDAIRNRNLRKGLLPATAKRVIDLKTNKSYNSAREAAEDIKMSHSTLKSMLNGARINKTNLQYENSYSNCRN